MNSSQIIRRLKKAGWKKIGQTGSHVHFKHEVHKGRVTVPHPKKDVTRGTMANIERQSGIKLK